jgi:hypothetical protein
MYYTYQVRKLFLNILYNETADSLLETPALEFMKYGVYVCSNPRIFEVVVRKGSE